MNNIFYLLDKAITNHKIKLAWLDTINMKKKAPMFIYLSKNAYCGAPPN